jgi:hypothetical protein
MTDVGSAPQPVSDDLNTPEAVEPDAEVSLVTKDPTSILPKAKIAANVALDDTLMRVSDTANQRGNGATSAAPRWPMPPPTSRARRAANPISRWPTPPRFRRLAEELGALQRKWRRSSSEPKS